MGKTGQLARGLHNQGASTFFMGKNCKGKFICEFLQFLTFIVNLRALHNQMIAQNRITGVEPIVLILSWGIGGMQGDMGVW